MTRQQQTEAFQSRYTLLLSPYAIEFGVLVIVTYLIQSVLYFAYRTMIGIGTKPAQLMRAMIDIEWADMIIPSVNCTNCENGLRYNSSESATHESNGTDLVIRTGGYVWGEGFVSQDTVTVGDGIEIPHHPFLEANKSWPCALCESDTILGLAIDKPEYVDPSQCSSKGKNNSGGCLPSPFSTLAKSGTLDRNIVSILLPRDDDDDIRVPPGEIVFGSLDEGLYEGPLSTHPLYPPGTTQWHIEATSASVSSANGTLLASESLPGYTARLHTYFPYTALPPFIGNAIMNATGADCSDGCKGCEVNCSTLHELPHVTINLGGHNITITGEDYTVKTDIQWPFCAYPGEYCQVNIGPDGSDGGEESKTIDLGTSFLRGVYSAYDFDDRSVHRESLSLSCQGIPFSNDIYLVARAKRYTL